MTDLEIFEKWHKTTIAKYTITENWQVGALLDFARYYHNEQLRSETSEHMACVWCEKNERYQSMGICKECFDSDPM